jgi:hypothetical protein
VSWVATHASSPETLVVVKLVELEWPVCTGEKTSCCSVDCIGEEASCIVTSLGLEVDDSGAVLDREKKRRSTASSMVGGRVPVPELSLSFPEL